MGTLSLVAPLVLFEKSRLWAGTGFHLLPSFHHHPTQHNNTTQTVTLSVTLTSTFSSTLYITLPTRNVVCPSSAWFENRPHLTPFICLAWNPKRVIVQWVGIDTHTHILIVVDINGHFSKHRLIELYSMYQKLYENIWIPNKYLCRTVCPNYT